MNRPNPFLSLDYEPALESLGDDYFDELLQRIQDIRTSEKRFYQKVCDIYATSVDYDPTHDMSIEFFKTVQNKMHWAITCYICYLFCCASQTAYVASTVGVNAFFALIRNVNYNIAHQKAQPVHGL